MTRLGQIQFLVRALLEEMPEYRREAEEFPKTTDGQRRLLRSLMNLRPPGAPREYFLKVQAELLDAETKEKGVVSLEEIAAQNGASLSGATLLLWQGDITRLAVDAIVNAANSALLGCFLPCHGCIDNAIHSAAGIELREACAAIMRQQGHPEPTGGAKITPAFHLPSRYVIHTVGPIIQSGVPTAEDEALLAGCYRSSLDLAARNGLGSIAFCCISTGEFHYPNEKAAEVAVRAVHGWRQENSCPIAVVFNVFKDEDAAIYRDLLSCAHACFAV